MASEFQPKRIIVTGAAGFVGGNFAHLRETVGDEMRLWPEALATYMARLSELGD